MEHRVLIFSSLDRESIAQSVISLQQLNMLKRVSPQAAKMDIQATYLWYPSSIGLTSLKSTGRLSNQTRPTMSSMPKQQPLFLISTMSNPISISSFCTPSWPWKLENRLDQISRRYSLIHPILPSPD